jgi:hypothetical protein
MGKGPAAAAGIAGLLYKLGAVKAVERREGEGITFAKSFTNFMIKCTKDDSIPLRTPDHYRIVMHRYSPILGLLSDNKVYCLMILIEYHLENASKRIVTREKN